MSTIKVIKKDAQIPIVIGTGYLQQLQSMFMSLINDKTDEQLETFGKCAKNQEEFPELWMEHAHTLIVLLQLLETSAEENGLTYETTADDAISQLES